MGMIAVLPLHRMKVRVRGDSVPGGLGVEKGLC